MRGENPFAARSDRAYRPVPPVDAAPEAAAAPEQPVGPLITAPGAYPEISNEDYHRNPRLLPEISLSSSGAKKILSQSSFHFWFDSPLNPDRPPEADKPHFSVGRAAHDIILLPDRWESHYFVLPEGFSRAKTRQFAGEIEEADAAQEAGLTLLRHEDAQTVRAVAAAIQRNKLAVACLTNGVTEETLAWQDTATGRWLRARPDFRPHSLTEKRDVRVVADLKFVAPTHMSPAGFSRAIANFGYHLSAAFYIDGLESVFGVRPTHWVHVVIEKDPPHCVAIYELPAEDIERGAALNRRAINQFHRCMSEGAWPGYSDEPTPVGLPIWARMNIDNSDPDEAAFAAAA